MCLFLNTIFWIKSVERTGAINIDKKIKAVKNFWKKKAFFALFTVFFILHFFFFTFSFRFKFLCFNKINTVMRTIIGTVIMAATMTIKTKTPIIAITKCSVSWSIYSIRLNVSLVYLSNCHGNGCKDEAAEIQWSTKRTKSAKVVDSSCWNVLVQRFQKVNGNNRWDKTIKKRYGEANWFKGLISVSVSVCVSACLCLSVSTFIKALYCEEIHCYWWSLSIYVNIYI